MGAAVCAVVFSWVYVGDTTSVLASLTKTKKTCISPFNLQCTMATNNKCWRHRGTAADACENLAVLVVKSSNNGVPHH